MWFFSHSEGLCDSIMTIIAPAQKQAQDKHNKRWELLYNHAAQIKPQHLLSSFPASTLLRMPPHLWASASNIPMATFLYCHAKQLHWFFFHAQQQQGEERGCRPQPSWHWGTWHVGAAATNSASHVMHAPLNYPHGLSSSVPSELNLPWWGLCKTLVPTCSGCLDTFSRWSKPHSKTARIRNRPACGTLTCAMNNESTLFFNSKTLLFNSACVFNLWRLTYSNNPTCC